MQHLFNILPLFMLMKLPWTLALKKAIGSYFAWNKKGGNLGGGTLSLVGPLVKRRV